MTKRDSGPNYPLSALRATVLRTQLLTTPSRWGRISTCANRTLSRAQSQAAKFHVPQLAPIADVLANPEIELIINLTTPDVHAEIGLAALRAGKSVCNEKPLAISREDGHCLLAEAEAQGLRVGCAPDTFLGGGLQTCRQLIDAGEIGKPVAATAINLNDAGGALLGIQGTTGTLSMPDPNMFGGPVRIRSLGEEEWRKIPLTHAHTGNDRCLGVADMAYALRTGRRHRASGELAYHVLDAMHAVLEASSGGQHMELASTCERPPALPAGLPEHQLTGVD